MRSQDLDRPTPPFMLQIRALGCLQVLFTPDRSGLQLFLLATSELLLSDVSRVSRLKMDAKRTEHTGPRKFPTSR